jgi:hypothetical protein
MIQKKFKPFSQDALKQIKQTQKCPSGKQNGLLCNHEIYIPNGKGLVKIVCVYCKKWGWLNLNNG